MKNGFAEDLAAETRFEPAPFLLQLGVVSSVSVPIQGHGGPFGVLDVRAREPRRFSEDDVAFLSAIATLITVAVDSSLLRAQVGAEDQGDLRLHPGVDHAGQVEVRQADLISSGVAARETPRTSYQVGLGVLVMSEPPSS